MGKTPSDPEQASVISAVRTPGKKPESPYVKGNTKLGPSATNDDDEHVEEVPPKLKLPPTTPSLFGFPSIEKSSEKGKKSKELIKAAEKREKEAIKGSKESTSSKGSGGKEKKPIIPGNHDWKEMKKEMAASTSSSGSPSTQSNPGIGSLNDGHRARSDENLFHDRDREKSISSSDSFDSKGRLIKKRGSKDHVRKTSSDGIRKASSGGIRKVSSGSGRGGHSPLSAKSTFGSSDSL